MTQHIADDFPSIAASLKKLERDKQASLNWPAQTNERLIPRVAEEAREPAKKLPPGPVGADMMVRDSDVGFRGRAKR